jgi:hypothetical protein
MKRVSVIVLVVISASVLTFGVTQGFKNIRELLTGYEEVPSVSTAASGEFNARINKSDSEVEYSLSYTELEGTIQQAHIHLGQPGVIGGISVFLCTNLGNGPAGTQPCPAPPATVTGTITAADISPNIPATQGARNQGLNTGEFDEFLEALRAGALYVNVHSTTWPLGEIRSQITHDHGVDHLKK